MQELRKNQDYPELWKLLDDVPGMLHEANNDGAPGQARRLETFGGDPALSRGPWPGCSLGIRAPGAGETALSVSEVEHYLRMQK